MILEYQCLRENAKRPTRSNPSDAGLDVYFNPSNGKEIQIHINESKKLETALVFEIPHGYMLKIENRSSMAGNRGLLVGGGVIDPGYSGEIVVNLINVGMEQPAVIKPGDKIAQLVLVPVVHFKAFEKVGGNLYEYPVAISERGDGGFGSTGT